MWDCPACGRRFGRRRQTHECAPAMPLDEYFATGPPHERPIFEAVLARLADVGPIHVEPVSVGVFLKRSRTFAELRPRDRWVNLSFRLPRALASARVRSRTPVGGGRTWYVVRLAGPGDVDAEVGDWLTEAYLDTPA